MTSKSKTAPTTKYPRKAVECPAGKDAAETSKNFSRIAVAPEFAALRVIDGAEIKSGMGERIDIPMLMEVLRDQQAAVNRGRPIPCRGHADKSGNSVAILVFEACGSCNAP